MSNRASSDAAKAVTEEVQSMGISEMPASPKFCIFGAGAIGGMIATLLARSGATVSVVARGRTAAALNRDGVRLIINSEMLRGSIQVSEDPSELGVQDYVVVAVKAPSLPDVARQIGPLLGPENANRVLDRVARHAPDDQCAPRTFHPARPCGAQARRPANRRPGSTPCTT